jgi:hypothetical protein
MDACNFHSIAWRKTRITRVEEVAAFAAKQSLEACDFRPFA